VRNIRAWQESGSPPQLDESDRSPMPM